MTACPCCHAAVTVPSLADLIASRRITGHAAAILEAVWRGKGMPVMPERLFDEMYADDPDGGPNQSKCYLEMHLAICELNNALTGSGVSVDRAGYRRGFRLAIDIGAVA